MLNQNKTEQAIKFVKDIFEKLLAANLHLRRVTAPLIIKSSSGLNDTLNGENPVKFYVLSLKEDCEIVQSLAKWKRMKLGELGLEPGYGIYTDMNAVRPNEELDELHSLYVDQWDWERVITKAEYDTGLEVTTTTIQEIYTTIRNTYYIVCEQYPELKELKNPFLPTRVFCTSSDTLANMYPNLTPKEREYELCKKFGVVAITKIGGKYHDGMRAPDYDDWEKNGDLLIWSPELQKPIEITSMGIRVNQASLHEQLEQSGHLDWENYEYHQKVLNNELPLTIGGGIGQSRLCMLMLHKYHIGEVQCSIWSDLEIEKYKNQNINLL